MKKNTKNILIAIIIVTSIVVLLQYTYILINYINNKKVMAKENSFSATAKAVIVEVNENSLCAMGIDNMLQGLFFVGFSEQGNIGYKQGQEILITWNGDVMDTYPAQLGKADKIEIIKEKSETEIPVEYLKYCYSSKEKVKVSIEEFTNESLGINIVDTNELPYEYTPKYIIYQEVKNKNYTGVGEKVGEDTENSIAGFTGTGSEYIWEEVQKVSNITSQDTAESYVYNLPNIVEGEHYVAQGWKLDYSKLYGKLSEGKYYFYLEAESFGIKIDFTVDKDGKVNYSEPKLD